MSNYEEKVSGIVNSALVGFALAMSKDAGILQVLLDAQQSLSSQQIADKKNLKERYVREILNSLATAEVIHVSKDETGSLVYHLDDSQKPVFKSPLFPFISFPAVISTVYETVKNCLPKTGPYGTRYSDAVHDVIEEFSTHHQGKIVESCLNLVDGLKEKLESGIEVIEFGCGRGNLVGQFAEMFPKSTFTASEFNPKLLEQLKTKLQGLSNVKYVVHDLCSLPDPQTKLYDWIFCVDVIHDLPNPPEALKGIRKYVKEDTGIFTMIDLATSGSPIDDKGKLNIASLYVASTFLCIPESFQREDSHALGACWGKKTAIELATAAGFDVKYFDLEHNLALYLCKPN